MTSTPHARRRRAAAGMSLVELMVALSVLTIGVVGFVGAFQVITRSIHNSRGRSLALSLAQEKIENLKTIGYQDLQITTQTTTNANLTWMSYDNLNYPPETISSGGMTFTRGVYVSLTRLTGSDISAVQSNFPDSGLKYITVFVVWQQGTDWKYVQLDNLYENPNVNPLDSTVQGVVRDNAGNAVAGAVVSILENTSWFGTAGSAGSYLFQVYGGTYSVHASSAGYYDATWTNTLVNDNMTLTTNFALVPIGTGTVTANVWISSGLVISQVVASTDTNAGAGSTQNVEYVELFNPTTYAINIGAAAGSAATQLNLYDHTWGTRLDAAFNWVYSSTYVPPLKYYLMASASTFFVMGHWVTSDAHYTTLYSNYIDAPHAVGIQLVRASDGAIYDTVGWSNGGDAPPVYSGSYIPGCGGNGIAVGTQIVRVSSPPDTTSDYYARAYDSGNNSVDFLYQELVCPGPAFTNRTFSSSDSTATLISGIPAVGALVTSQDFIGPSTKAYTQNYASTFPGKSASPVATFSLKGVSTGTWTVLLASGVYYATTGGAAVTQNNTLGIPNAATTPAWNSSGFNSVFLSTPAAGGYVQGLITDVNNAALPGISVIAGGATLTTGANGRYFAAVATGAITVTANPNNVNTTYAQSIGTGTISAGQVLDVNMTLSQAGTLMGFVTSDGSTGMSGIAVTATSSGTQSGLASTASSGYFYLKNITTGTYTVQPVLDPLSTSSPVSITTSPVARQTVFVGTFTVTGATGKVSGTVTYKSKPLVNGALILVSTQTLTSSPPTIVASSSPAQAVIYAGSSKADGTYSIDVRGSTTTSYNLSAYVPIVTPTGATISTKTYSGIMVYSTGTTTVNVTVP